MGKLGLLMKSIGIRALVIGSCLAFITVNAAFANVNAADPAPRAEMINKAGGGMSSVMPGTQSHDGYGSEALKEKHQEIDKYVFEQRNGDFSEQGFTVTNTGPSNGKIEIGISPYDDSKAKYLYDIFGRELVEVVEGIQAVTLVMPVSPMEISTASPNEQKNGNISSQGSTSSAEAEFVDVDVMNGDYQTNMPFVDQPNRMDLPVSSASAPMIDAITQQSPTIKSSNILYTTSILVVVILLGGAAFIIRRIRTTQKEA